MYTQAPVPVPVHVKAKVASPPQAHTGIQDRVTTNQCYKGTQTADVQCLPSQNIANYFDKIFAQLPNLLYSYPY
jgi:hypothetical protein